MSASLCLKCVPVHSENAVRITSGVSPQLGRNLHPALSCRVSPSTYQVAAISTTITATMTTIIVILLFFGVSCVSNTENPPFVAACIIRLRIWHFFITCRAVDNHEETVGVYLWETR